jgi:hypothetical protein
VRGNRSDVRFCVQILSLLVLAGPKALVPFLFEFQRFHGIKYMILVNHLVA